MTTEAERLRAFIGKYVKSGNAKYADFEKILNKYLEDGVAFLVVAVALSVVYIAFVP